MHGPRSVLKLARPSMHAPRSTLLKVTELPLARVPAALSGTMEGKLSLYFSSCARFCS